MGAEGVRGVVVEESSVAPFALRGDSAVQRKLPRTIHEHLELSTHSGQSPQIPNPGNHIPRKQSCRK